MTMAIDADIQPFLDAITASVTALTTRVTKLETNPVASTTITTLAGLNAALTAGTSPCVLASGNYGALVLTTKFPKMMTISSADKYNPATFTSITLTGVTNLILDNIATNALAT